MEQPQPLTDDELEGARVVVNRSISLVTLANIAPRLLATVDALKRQLDEARIDAATSRHATGVRLSDEQIAWHARTDSGSTPQEHAMAREIQLLRAILAASPDHLPLARVAEIHADAITMGG